MIGTESNDEEEQHRKSKSKKVASSEEEDPPSQFVQPRMISGAFLTCGWSGPGSNKQIAQVGCRVESEDGRKISNDQLAWQVQHAEQGPVDLVSSNATTSSKINRTFDVDIKRARKLSLTVANNGDGQKLATFNLVNLPGLQDRNTLECIDQRYSHDCIDELSSQPAENPVVGNSAVPFPSLDTTAVLLSRPRLYQRTALYSAGQFCDQSGMTQKTIGNLNFRNEQRTLQFRGTDKTCFRSFATFFGDSDPYIIPSRGRDSADIPYCYFLYFAQEDLAISGANYSTAVFGGLKYSYVMTVANPAAGGSDPRTATEEHHKFVERLVATTKQLACPSRLN